MKSVDLVRKGLLLLGVGCSMLISSGQAWGSVCWENSRTGYFGHRRHHGSHWTVRYHCQWPAHPVKVVQRVYDDTVVINIPNDNGSYTPVTLRRAGGSPACWRDAPGQKLRGSYIGPRGEYYTTMPTVEQLKMVYGLK